MNSCAKIFETLRRQKRAIARVVLPLLTVVWFSSGASLCFGMTTDANADVAPGNVAVHAHEHGQHAKPPRADAEHADHEHGSCPHCPAGVSDTSISAEHIGCTVLNDLPDAGAAAAKAVKSELSLALPVAHLDFRNVVSMRTPARELAARAATLGSSAVPLNIRHCVFLI